jgi:hypothetical protein
MRKELETINATKTSVKVSRRDKEHIQATESDEIKNEDTWH